MRISDSMADFVTPDFVPRAYSRPIRQLSVVYLVAVAIIFLISNFHESLGGNAVSTVLIMAVVCAIAIYTLVRRQQHNDQMLATEFENLLFSAAAALGSNFCIFLKSDGTIIYANDGTRRMFPHFSRHQTLAIDELLNEAHVDKVHLDKLYSALSLGRKENLIFEISNSAGERSDYIVMIEPLKRPSGYFVLRGRSYYKERKAAVKLEGRFEKTSTEKLSILMESLPFPVFITNPSGVLEYVNQALEKMLGYDENQLVAQGVTLQKLVYHADGFETGEFELTNFSGAVMLSKRNQQLLRAQLTQELYYDDHGKLSGCGGYILE